MVSSLRLRCSYIIGDYLMTNLAWFLFNIFRFGVVDASKLPPTFSEFYDLPDVRLGQFLFPVLMIGIFYLSGYYRTVIFKSRFEEFLQSLLSTLIGAILIFFIAIVNDTPGDRETDYKLIGCLWMSMFLLVYLFRSLITNVISGKLSKRSWTFNTLIVGDLRDARKLLSKIEPKMRANGMKVVGFVTNSVGHADEVNGIHVYDYGDIESVARQLSVSRLILIPEEHELPSVTLKTMYSLFSLGISVYLPPSVYHILLARPKVTSIIGEPLINVSEANVNDSTMCVKRMLDIVVSSVALICLMPVFAIIAIAIKLDSDGTVFYTQERIGYHKRPFKIVKFRSMVADAEASGPSLSTDTDARVTRVGHFLRKYRIDELPQFWNVLKGDMSLIGPRPERAYYIGKIMEKAPYYSLIHQVRPGITSLGMVKFGYASTVDEMIERLNYDLIYLENISFSIDFKIFCYTILTVLRGRGV